MHLHPEAIGRTIKDVTVSEVVIESKEQGKEAIIKGLSTDDFIQQMKQMSIVNVTRRSKYIYYRLSKKGITTTSSSAILACRGRGSLSIRLMKFRN